ncbi:hypothetical protein [Marinobacter sp. X15-166B]|uniref:hypothetical protein n=1 Tax=Marinobacter sp. X15-166B TaxID=1897620 RepID=UPI00085CA407|nr:hypothetical protein [Marinobacter sp. X15-166B]OEY67334.1 hypothetical protein BG841_13375 [Marinobacter sp. X15-166B]
MKRREIKEAHERSVIRSFKRYLKQQDRMLVVLGYPDPPDARVEIDQQPIWIEITDAFINGDFARSLTSHAADDLPPVPTEPDGLFVEEVKTVVMKKYEKDSISDIFHRRGPGILLVGLYSPFVGNRERDLIIQELSHLKNTNDGRFSEIFVYDQAQHFYPVP